MRTHVPASREVPTAETRRSLAGDSRAGSLHDRHAGYLRPALRLPIPERERFCVGSATHDGMFAGGLERGWRMPVLVIAILAAVGALGFLGWHQLAWRGRVPSARVLAATQPAAPVPVPAAAPARRPPAALAAPGGVLNAPVTRIEVWKSERRLLIYAGGKPVKACRIALGENAVGTKTREGDGKTPEGTYYICGRNPNGRYGPALGISYPGPDDAAKGQAAGVISEDESAAISAAWERHVAPPWTTGLGGSLFIQGNGAKSDWTHGSIALEDAAVRELYKWTADGVPVVIHP